MAFTFPSCACATVGVLFADDKWAMWNVIALVLAYVFQAIWALVITSVVCAVFMWHLPGFTKSPMPPSKLDTEHAQVTYAANQDHVPKLDTKQY